MKILVTVLDFESGAYTALAGFVRRKWPIDSPLKLSHAQAVVAKCFGYKDFHDVQQSTKTQTVQNISNIDEIKAFAAIVLVRDFQFSPETASKFVETWPMRRFSFANPRHFSCP